ncbi:MAG: DUF1499 domain-containing protein [Pseudomonadota bacterium]
MKSFFAVLFAVAILVALGYFGGNKLAADSRVMTVRSSLDNNELAPCPPEPNCVNSDSMPTDSHFIVPISDTDGTRWAKLVATVGKMEGAQLVLSTDNYAYFTFTTKLFGFMNDVEFYRRPAAGLIAIRSASRVGMLDLGTNRRRLEDIRVALGL